MTEEQLAEIDAGLARDAEEPYPEHWETCTPSRMSPLIAEIRRLRAAMEDALADEFGAPWREILVRALGKE